MNRSLTRRARAAVAAAVAAGLLAVAASLPSAGDGVAAPPRTAALDVAYAPGDDNRDGRVDEDESGWDCRSMGNGLCGADVPPECRDAGEALELCATVASRPAYGWANPDGSRADNPDGRAMVRDLEERPGTPEFAAALRALDAEWRAHR
ncbi:hypothetical protein HFP70_35465 [Streptomyces sp. ARC14]|uniref:hypothetical protein n=1 Tax=Streptomyces sp. ARC14 TaxID=2724152 RepID=UPI003857D3E5